MILDPLSPNIENHTQDEIIEFWEKTESIANIPKENLDESHVNSSLVAYLKFATDSYKVFINTDRDLYRMSLILLESSLFEFKKEFCLSKLQSLLNIDLLEMNMKFIIVYILLCEAKKKCALLRDYAQVPRIYCVLQYLVHTIRLFEQIRKGKDSCI